MKFLLLSLLLWLQASEATIQQYKLNEMRVIIYDDCRLPYAKVGVIYSVGLHDFNNTCEAEMIEQLFLSKDTKIAANGMGTDIDMTIYQDFSNISAIVPNDQIVNFIQLILNNKNLTDDFSLVKKKIKMNRKLIDYFETNITYEQLYASLDHKYIFNQSILDNFTEANYLKYMDKYKQAHIDIIICGNVDQQQIAQQLHLTPISPNEDTIVPKTFEIIKKTSNITSKFMGRSLFYVYRPDQTELLKKQDAILAIINHEMFYYLKKYSQMIEDVNINILPQSSSFMIGFSLKRDISKKEFQIAYNNLFFHLKKIRFTPEKLKYISNLVKLAETDRDHNISEIYRILLHRYIFHIYDTLTLSAKILTVTSDDIKNFVEQTLEKNCLVTISTRYKAEN